MKKLRKISKVLKELLFNKKDLMVVRKLVSKLNYQEVLNLVTKLNKDTIKVIDLYFVLLNKYIEVQNIIKLKKRKSINNANKN